MATALPLVFALAAMENALALMALLFLGGTLSIGAYEAWSRQRGVLGWLVSLGVSVVGGTVGGMGLSIGAMAVADATSKGLGPKWAELDASVGLLAMVVGLLLGCWLALRIVNLLR
jgi:hypothetical protein